MSNYHAFSYFPFVIKVIWLLPRKKWVILLMLNTSWYLSMDIYIVTYEGSWDWPLRCFSYSEITPLFNAPTCFVCKL